MFRCLKHQLSLSNYHSGWVALVRLFLEISAKNPNIVRLKKMLGCISMIPIQVENEAVKVQGVHLTYHDLYHLEVFQLDRIKMGKDWVSGIHGINIPLFHESPILEEYDGFLDEARVAIHEGLTNRSAFSQIKFVCWMILLMLRGINSLAVVIRHIGSIKKRSHSFGENSRDRSRVLTFVTISSRCEKLEF